MIHAPSWPFRKPSPDRYTKPSAAPDGPPRTPLAAPVGYEFMGEFRAPKDEWFLDTSSGRPFYVAGDLVAGRFPILKRTAPPANFSELVHQRLREPYVAQEPPMPVPPEGWKIVARRNVVAGEFFMQSSGLNVWYADKTLYKDGPFAWVVEPTIPRPARAPWFTIKYQYRVPKVGEWFLAKGSGPAAQENDPVRLGPYDVVPKGPRWILELHK